MNAQLACMLDDDNELSLATFLACQKRVWSNVNVRDVMPHEAYDVNDDACDYMCFMSMDVSWLWL